ncbi:MAG: GNAT family N-acetyltransferase [bacterium]
MNDSSSAWDTQVRPAERADLDFIVACNRAMAAETEDEALDAVTLSRGITYLMDHPAEGFYLVAQHQYKPVGTLMVTFEWSDWRAGRFWWIQSVYVLPDYRRRGVYSVLHDSVRKQAQTDHLSCGIRLYVEQDNQTAQKTYRHMGMHETHYRLYEELFSQQS